jgi:hypothetical protein
MIPNIPELKILPLEQMILHEDHDLQRTLPLVEKLRAQGILRNPPVVMPLTDDSGRYMVLDGANRVTSLRAMECPHIVAQVVQPDDKNVTLQTWNHIVWGMDSEDLIEAVCDVEAVNLIKIDPQKSFDPPTIKPLHIRLPNGELYLANLPAELIDRVGALHSIVDCYKEIAMLDRTSQTLSESFKAAYPDMTALIIFPRFNVPTILYLAGENCVLPTGITRFTVSPRALHLNYPLHELASGKPIEYKEAYLQHWVVERIKNKGVRHYIEATFLFDE